MTLFVGLDISVKTTAICIVDGAGKGIAELTVDSSPEAISEQLKLQNEPIERVGLEAGALSEWIYAGLVDAGWPAICVETRHMHAVLAARINKTDRNDARGIAQMMRVGLIKAVHVKTPASRHRRLLLTSRKLLQRKIYDIENDLRGSLRTFGLKIGMVASSKFEARVRELVDRHPIVARIIEPLLEARAVLRAQFARLHRMLLELVRADPVCRRLMSAPGVGPVVALTFRTCVDNPARFSRSKCVQEVAKAAGLTAADYQILAVGGVPTRWALLKEGKFDAGLRPFPLSYEAEAAGFSNLGPVSKYVSDYQFTSINLDSKWGEAYRKLVGAALHAIRRGQEYLDGHQHEAAEIAAEECRRSRW